MLGVSRQRYLGFVANLHGDHVHITCNEPLPTSSTVVC
jgi:hypothetical protein